MEMHSLSMAKNICSRLVRVQDDRGCYSENDTKNEDERKSEWCWRWFHNGREAPMKKVCSETKVQMEWEGPGYDTIFQHKTHETNSV